MKPCTKFIIALWVFFLLSLVVHAQRAVGNGTPVASGGSGITQEVLDDSTAAVRADAISAQQLADSVALRAEISVMEDSFAAIRGDIPDRFVTLLEGDTVPVFTYGVLSTVYPGYTYSQLKTIRQANWESFQAAVNWQKSANGRRVVVPNIVEMHVNSGETITLSTGQTAVIIGLGQDVSKIYFYPIVKAYDVVIIDASANNTNVTMTGISIENTPMRHETYNAVARPGGVTNQVQITDSQVSAYLTANFVGKTINVATNNSITPTPSFTVTAYNPSTKVITVGSTISLSNNDTVYIATDFLEDTPIDTVTAYGEFWAKSTGIWYFINSVKGDVATYSKYLFDDVKSVGFDLFVFASGENLTIEARNSYFSGHHGSFFRYSNFETDSKIIFDKVVLEDNGYFVYAYIDVAYTAGNYYGSAVYSHPNIQWLWDNVYVINNNAAAVRQYSSGGNKPTPAWATSMLTGCRFINNVEYSIQTSQDMPVYFVNCYFEGNCYFNSDVIITNAKFKDASINTYSSGTKLKLINSSLYGTDFNLAGSIIEIDGCEIETIQDEVNGFAVYDTDRVFVRNTRFLNNSESPVVGCSVLGNSFGEEMVFENVSFEDTNTPLFWRYASDVGLLAHTKASYKPAKFTKCTFAYTSLVGSSQYVYYNNAIFDECVFGANPENKGRWVFKPRDDFYPTTLSGSTVSPSVNYNRYFTTGSITKINSPGVGLSGPYYFTAAGTTIFNAYATPGNTGSNVNFSDTLQAGETVSLMWNPLDIKASSTTLVSGENIGSTASGVLLQHRWGEIDFGSSTIVPGTVTITAGGITFTDDGRGNLNATGGSGWIGYETNLVTLYFDADPGVTSILITYSYYNSIQQAGMWSKID